MADSSEKLSAHRQNDSGYSQKPDSIGNALEDFGRSLVYSATQKPVDGVLEAIDHARGTQLVKDATFIDAPEKVKPYSLRWHAQAFGNALGSLVPLFIAGGAISKLGGGILEDGTATGLLPKLVGANADRLFVARAGLTGMAMDGIFNPIGVDHGNYWSTRALHGAEGFGIFSTMSGGAVGLQKAASLDLLNPVAPLLESKIGSNMLTGVAVSPLSAELNSLIDERRNANLSELGQSAYLMGINGLAIGGIQHLTEPQAKTNADNAAENRNAPTQTQRAGENVSDTKLAMMEAMHRSTGDGLRRAPSTGNETAKGEVAPQRAAEADRTEPQQASNDRPIMRQLVSEPPPDRVYSIDSILKSDPASEGHSQEFSALRKEFPDDFYGLKSALPRKLAQGGDSLVFDLAPSDFRDNDGNIYSRAVMKIMEAPEESRPGEGWQTPEWNSEWGTRGLDRSDPDNVPVDIPMLRLNRDSATTEAKEIAIGGKRYYIFMQPKGEVFGGGATEDFDEASGDRGLGKLLEDEAYRKWERSYDKSGLDWLDSKTSAQVVKYYMMEQDPAHPEAPPRVVPRFGLVDYPAIGHPVEDEVDNTPATTNADDVQDEIEEREKPQSEQEQLEDRGLHVIEDEAVDSQSAELRQTVLDYKDGGVPRKQIEETVRILYADYLEEHGITAKQAVDNALRKRA